MPRSVFAGENETKIGTTVAEVGTRKYATDAIDQYANATYNLGKPGTAAATPVQTTLSVFEIGVGLKELHEAKSDKERLFASMDITAGVLGIILPPAGFVAQLVVIVAKMADLLVSIESQKKMLVILKKIREYEKTYDEALQKMTWSENIRIQAIVKKLNFAAKNIAELTDASKHTCSSITEDVDFSILDTCLVNFETLIVHHRQAISANKELLTLDSQYIDIDKVFTALGLSRSELQKAIESSEITLKKIEDAHKVITEVSARALANTVFKSVEKKGQLSKRENLFRFCVNDMNDLLAANTLVHIASLNKSQDIINEARENRQNIIDRIRSKKCFENLNRASNGLFEKMLLNMQPDFDEIIQLSDTQMEATP